MTLEQTTISHTTTTIITIESGPDFPIGQFVHPLPSTLNWPKL